MSKFYITTSIAYANAGPHLGYALECVQADTLARYHRLKGDDVFFLTGMDEHGRKVAQAAEQEGVAPQKFVDGIAKEFRALKEPLSLSYDDFIRTTDRVRHFPSAHHIWEQFMKRGDIYKQEYTGLYCVGCEAFITEKEIVDGTCRIHGKELQTISEENYFFRLSKYADQIGSSIQNGALRIVPEGKKNEMLQFIKEGLQDVSFSRPSKDLSWGIPVPGDATQTMYVWADALINYISALSYQLPTTSYPQRMHYWPADVHCIGKDIIKFHALYWPGILFSLGLALPKTLLVHGFITVGGQKMSKSVGNVVDPLVLSDTYGGDAVRYFLLRAITPHEDGDFTEEKFRERYNADLANGIGNFAARVLALRDAQRVVSSEYQVSSGGMQKIIKDTKAVVAEKLVSFKFNEALMAIWDLIRFGDQHVNEHKPWETKDEKIIGDLVVLLREVAELLQPFLPVTAEKILTSITSGETLLPLFPRA